jgi:hypothetical protein
MGFGPSWGGSSNSIGMHPAQFKMRQASRLIDCFGRHGEFKTDSPPTSPALRKQFKKTNRLCIGSSQNDDSNKAGLNSGLTFALFMQRGFLNSTSYPERRGAVIEFDSSGG